MAEILLLKAINERRKDIEGFYFPEYGKVKSDYFIRDAFLNTGIKGVPYGLSKSKRYIDNGNTFIVVRVEEGKFVKADCDIIKFSEGYVVFSGTKDDAYEFIIKYHNKNEKTLKAILRQEEEDNEKLTLNKDLIRKF